MTTIVKRIAKGSTLTVAELDANVTNLNNTKLETTGGTLTGLPVLANQDIDIISPVYPTTKPSLNLDFTRGQLDPRITFARNSTAAYYDGQTSALAEQNLLLWSQDFSNAFWIKSGVTAVQNNATAPDGTMTAATLTSVVGGYLFNSIVGTFSGTFSIYIRRTVGTGNITVRTAAGVDTPITVTSTWSRVAIASTNPNFVLGLATTGDAVEIWGVQAEARASVTAYTPTTTAAITNYIPVLMTAPAGVARFDCDPITGKPLGLLIEESRTNFLTYSGSISPLTAYTEFSTTINTLQNISPDGTLSASLLTPSAVNSEHYAYTSNTAPLTSGTSYTYSIYVKAKGYNFVTLFLGNGAFPSAGRMANFNLLAGVVDGAQSGVTTSIFSVGDGWYRCSITATCVLSSASIITGMGAQNISNPSGNNLTFTGVGTSGI